MKMERTEVETYIRNSEQLLLHGDKKLRKMALQIIESALNAANPYQATKNLVYLDVNKLIVGPHEYDLSKRGKIYVVGAGKATFPIAKALEEILGDKISEGIIILKKGQNEKLDRIRIVEASHPLPCEEGLRGTREIFALANRAQEGDIVFSCITGGSSALLTMPVDSVTLNEKKEVNRLLLSCGATIFEINAVRQHLSKIKGGRLGMAIFPAELINLTVSDVIGDPLDYITDPTVPSTSVFEDALMVLKKYHLLNKVPESVRAYIETADPDKESPKDYGSNTYYNFILTNNDSACNAASSTAESLGLNSMILSTMFDGESRELGKIFAAIAKEIRNSHRPLKLPCILIGGGETFVTLEENFGKGGPNQEFVLSTVLDMKGQDNYVVVGLDTDGTDGPTEAAGAIADAFTVSAVEAKGIDLHNALQKHETLSPLMSLGDAIFTGHTGTNVNDLKFIICT